MKSLLIVLLVSICAIAWRTPEIMDAIGMARAKPAPAAPSLQAMTAASDKARHKPMTAEEFARLSKTDPHAYQKFVNSYQVEQERSEVDKLLNFFTRGRYE